MIGFLLTEFFAKTGRYESYERYAITILNMKVYGQRFLYLILFSIIQRYSPCRANQWSGFYYMIRASVMKELTVHHILCSMIVTDFGILLFRRNRMIEIAYSVNNLRSCFLTLEGNIKKGHHVYRQTSPQRFVLQTSWHSFQYMATQ